MATLSVTIPTAITPRVLDAVSYNNGYTDLVTNMITGVQTANPISKSQFCKNLVKDWIKANVKTYEIRVAEDAAAVAAALSADTDITIGD